MGRVFIDLTGQTFGRWTVLRRAENRRNLTCWLCSCSCGTTKEVRSTQLRNGNSKSCGCFQKERATECATTHGKRKIQGYNAWWNMIDRCYNENNKKFNHYGGRGITVCDKWKNDVSSFLRDMGPRPSPRHSVDRIENNKGYSPDNCRWATYEVQSHNQRLSRRNTTGVRGVSIRNDLGKYTAVIYVKNKRVYLGHFDTIEEAAIARIEAEKMYW